ncbi:MAG: crosslink repair DNA glycosylase YcaQ family protein, partial [Candidatus Bathyarchaeia archaeon]
PATQQDFALWSGLMAGDAKRAIEKASSLLTRVTVEGSKGSYLLLKEDMKNVAFIDLDEEAPLRLLPKFDSMLLGHKDRARIIQEKHKKRVFKPKVGDISATVLADGRIVGTWKQKKTKKTLTITLELFEKIGKEDLKQAEREAKELSHYMGLTELKFVVTP